MSRASDHEQEEVASQSAEDRASKLQAAASGAESSLVGEFWAFVKENKAWWMIPILLMIGLLAVLVVISSTGAAPFIYTLF